MSFLFVDTSLRQHDHVLHALKESFNAPAKQVASAAHAIDYLKSHRRTLSAVLFNTSELATTLIPVLKHLADFSPLTASLLISSRSEKKLVAKIQTEFMLDHICFKPLQTESLIQSLLIASKKKIKKDNTLYLISKNAFREVIPGINVVPLESIECNQLQKAFRGILIDSTSLSSELAIKLKKKLRDVMRPIGLYGTDNEAAWILKDLATSIHPTRDTLTNSIRYFSENSQNFLFRIFITRQLKSAHGEGNFKVALKLSEKLSHLEPFNSLPHTLAADVLQKLNHGEDAIKSYRRAIDVNPFHPENYLRLLELFPGETALIQRAKRYCPNHPQIAELTLQNTLPT